MDLEKLVLSVSLSHTKQESRKWSSIYAYHCGKTRFARAMHSGSRVDKRAERRSLSWQIAFTAAALRDKSFLIRLEDVGGQVFQTTASPVLC